MVSFIETGKRNEMAAIQHSRDGRTSDGDDCAVELGAKQHRLGGPSKLSLAELSEGVKDCSRDCKQYYFFNL